MPWLKEISEEILPVAPCPWFEIHSNAIIQTDPPGDKLVQVWHFETQDYVTAGV